MQRGGQKWQNNAWLSTSMTIFITTFYVMYKILKYYDPEYFLTL